MRTHFICLGLLLCLMAGCADGPFTRQPMPMLQNANPEAIRAEFAANIPRQILTDDTVIIDSVIGKMAGLGCLKIDRQTGTFELLCMNHMGVQLFYLGGDQHHTIIHYAVPPLLERKEILLAIAQDIRRMYFDLVPEPTDATTVHSRNVLFTDNQRYGELVYEFGGADRNLVEKRFVSHHRTIWRVRYYDFTPTPGAKGLHPRGMVLDNYQYHYTIVVKNRSWQYDQGSAKHDQ